MISFEKYPLNGELSKELSALQIDFAFQPIYYADTKNVYAYEALMRPHNMTVTELIHTYMQMGKLHILEIASLFGAAEAYMHRGYDKMLSINSFPSEALTEEEAIVFDRFYHVGYRHSIMDVLELPSTHKNNCRIKREQMRRNRISVSIDDYEHSEQQADTLSFYQPDIVKLEKNLISDIHTSTHKQTAFRRLLHRFHRRGVLVLAKGVETKEECHWLKDHGIDLMQGYYLGKPE